MNRIQSTIPALDEILHGGFPAASINIITGSPGTGKTVLAQQLVYGNATPDRRVLYLTTVNEPMHKVLRYVQNFGFFNQEKLDLAVRYEDVGAVFETGDVQAVMKKIEDLVMQESPAILIVDSFKALSDLASDSTTFRRALYRLTGVLTASGCTAFLLGEYEADAVGTLPEFAVADGIVDLTNERRGIRTYRYLTVVKLRGSDFVDGRHRIRITKAGLKVFQRFRTPELPVRYRPSMQRVGTGVPDLDELLGGGFLEGSNTLVGGLTGLGKTILGLTFSLEQAARDEPVVLASFQEDPNQLERLAENAGGDLTEAQESGNLRLVYVSPVELDLDEHVLRIVEAVEEIGAKSLVIDSLSDLEEGAYDEERFLNFVFSLIQYLKDRGITSVMTYDLASNATSQQYRLGLSRLADNLILLEEDREQARILRRLRIVKTRGMDHDHDVHLMRLTGKGLQIDRARPS